MITIQQHLSPPPPREILINTRYVLCTPTKAWSWDICPSGFIDRKEHASIYEAIGSVGYMPAVVHTIDPITAVTMNLVTTTELQGHVPGGFLALLNLLNK